MTNLTMFCISMNPEHINKIKKLNYTPVGLGGSNFSNEWMQDNKGENISQKNKYFGEYTFHYWLWKNYLDKIEDGWIGFCQYRKFWSKDTNSHVSQSFDELETNVLKKIIIPDNEINSILGDEIYINNFKLMKFIKRGFKILLKKPRYIYDKKSRNIKFHFDMWHGSHFLDKAIDLLDTNDKDDFKKFVNTKVSFNPHNMFIVKSKKILKEYYSVLFRWLDLCEKEFGFENLIGYGQVRIYGFLAERFMSYWFQKNTQYTTIPILFYDLGKN
jgi:hypothetical protein